MKDSSDVVFCDLLRIAFGLSQKYPHALTETEWKSLLLMAQQQSVVGVIYHAILHLPQDSRPPRRILLNWSCATEAIQGANRQINQEAARYTRLFMDRGFKSVILKGPANSLLYPDPLSRQAGDVDIWIPGGSEKVERLLLDMDLIPAPKNAYRLSHHIAFRTENGFNIEVHHRPADVAFRNAEFQEVLLCAADAFYRG